MAVIGFEVAVGFLIAWAVRKAGRLGRRVDTEVDQAMDAGLDRLHDLVVAKLGKDPALEKLRVEATESGEVGARTQARVRLALEEATEQDRAFAAALESELVHLHGGMTQAGDHGVAVSGGVHAGDGGVAIGGVTGGSVSFGEQRDPPGSMRP